MQGTCLLSTDGISRPVWKHLRFNGRSRRLGPFVAHSSPLLCLVSRHALQGVPGHPLQLRWWVFVLQPAINNRRLLADEVEFPYQGPAVVHQNPLLEG